MHKHLLVGILVICIILVLGLALHILINGGPQNIGFNTTSSKQSILPTTYSSAKDNNCFSEEYREIPTPPDLSVKNNTLQSENFKFIFNLSSTWKVQSINTTLPSVLLYNKNSNIFAAVLLSKIRTDCVASLLSYYENLSKDSKSLRNFILSLSPKHTDFTVIDTTYRSNKINHTLQYTLLIPEETFLPKKYYETTFIWIREDGFSYVFNLGYLDKPLNSNEIQNFLDYLHYTN